MSSGSESGREDKERRLALRRELDRTCHAVTQSGLELERFYNHFQSELQRIEEEKRQELQMQLKRKVVELEVWEREQEDIVSLVHIIVSNCAFINFDADSQDYSCAGDESAEGTAPGQPLVSS